MSLLVPVLALAAGAVMAFDGCLTAATAGDFTVAARFLVMAALLGCLAGKSAVLYLSGLYTGRR